MEKHKSKKWLEKIQNYYETLQYFKSNNIVGKIVVEDDFYSTLVDFINVVCFAPKRFYVLYIEHYCKGRTLKEIAEELGYSYTQIYNIHKSFLEWLENKI